jgi:nitrate/nitrite transporter NarK
MYGFTSLPRASGGLFLIGGLAAFLVFGWLELRTKSPVLNLRLFRGNPVFTFNNLAALIHYSSTNAMNFLLSMYLQFVKGLDAQAAGFLLIAKPVVQALLSPIAGKLSDRIQPRFLAASGMLLTSGLLGAMALLSRETPVGVVVGALMLFGLGIALFASPNVNSVMSSVDKETLGVASGMLGTMRLTGQTMSFGIANLVFALHLGSAKVTAENAPSFMSASRDGFIIFAALCLAGVFASLVHKKNISKQGEQASTPVQQTSNK